MKPSSVPSEVSGRAYLYNFDFLKFGAKAQETIQLANPFLWQGVCWKFRYPGVIVISVGRNWSRPIFISADITSKVGAMELAIPCTVERGEQIRVEVRSLKARWFRRNHAFVTLEGLETE